MFLLAGEVPDPPAHVLQPVAPLHEVVGCQCLDPRPAEFCLVDAAHHLVHEVTGRVEMPPLPSVNGFLLVLDGA